MKILHGMDKTDRAILFSGLAVALISVAGLAAASAGHLFTSVQTNTQTVTVNPTVTATPIVTVTQTTITGTTYTTTGSTAYFVPAAMYYAANDGSSFTRSLSLYSGNSNGAAFSETADANGSAVSGTVTCASTIYCDLGFYYIYGSLSTITSHPITATGTGFAINIWINPDQWAWNGDTYSSVGTIGAYGLGTTTGTATVSASSDFYITSAASGSCLAAEAGLTLSVAQIQGDCPSATFALWFGTVGSPTGASFAVQSVSQPYP